MKKVYIQLITPVGTFKGRTAELNSEEFGEIQNIVKRVSDGDYNSFSITDENDNQHYFNKNIISNSVISIIVNQ